MVSYTELQTRLARFVDAEMLPHMTGGKRILLGGYAALATKNAAGMLQAAKDKPLVAMTGAVSEEGVDVDALFSAVSPYINEPVTLSLPVVGDFRLNRSDFEKLYRYLKGEL